MAVIIGGSKNTSAARAALNINWAVERIVNVELKNQYPSSDYTVRYSVGVDASDLFIARTGIRGSNDLVWVGRAANYAAKLCTLRDGNYVSWIAEDVYHFMHDDAKYSNGTAIWEKRTWTAHGIDVYRSSWWWEV